MKKILCLFLTVTMVWSLFVPAGVYAAESTVLQQVRKFDFTGYKTGTTGDYTSPSLGDGVIIRTYDTADDQVCITEASGQGSVMKFGPAKTSYDSGICMRKSAVEDANPVVSLKIKPQAANNSTWVNPGCIDIFSSTSRICRLWLRWGSTGDTDYPRNLYLRNETGSGWGSEHLIASGFDNGTPGWLDIKLVFNHTAQTYDIYVGGISKATGESYFDTTADTDIREIYFHCAGNNGSLTVDDIKIFKKEATKLVLAEPADGASNADLTDTLTFTSNNENLVVNDAVLTITPEGKDAITISDAASVNENDKKTIQLDLSAADFEMDYETKYTVSLSGIKDTNGDDVKTVTGSFTTRAPRLIIGEGAFKYNDADNTMDGSVVILNEKKDSPLNAAVIFAAFYENEMKDAAVHEDTVSGGKEKTLARVLEYNADYTYKAFVWDSITGMSPIGSYENASSAEVEANIDYLSGEGQISGTLEKGSCATAIILRPDCDLSQLNEDGSNLKDIIAYAGQQKCADDGSYSMDFALNLPSEANGKEITVLAGGSGITAPEKTTFVYYNKKTVEDIFSAVTNAESGQAIADLISGKTTVNGIKINDILKLDTKEYDELTDKAAALENLMGMKFTDIESVHTAFVAAVAKQKANETASSEFTPVFFDFEPVNGIVSPGWDGLETTNSGVAKVESREEALSEDATNSFYRFTFNGVTLEKSVDWRIGITLDKAITYNDTPKVISYKFRLDGAAKHSNRIEMLDSTSPQRATKEFILNSTGATVYGKTVSTGVSDGDEWHTLEIIMDGTGKLDKETAKHKKYILLDGEPVNSVEIGTDNGVKTEYFDIKRIQMYSGFSKGTVNESVFDFDDLRVDEYKAPQIVSTIPGKGEKFVDITNKIKVVFDKGVSGITADNIAVYGGEKSVEVSGVGHSLDNKTVTFTLDKNLDYSTAYKVVISGIKDDFGQDVTPYILEFSTRERQLLAGSPVYSPASGGTTDCTVTVTNEGSLPQEATVVFASFDGDKMTEAKIITKKFTGSEDFSENLSESDESKIRVFVWNSLAGMQPLALHPVVASAETDVKFDYKTGLGTVSGTLTDGGEDSVATVLLLKPGKTVNDTEPIAYIGETACDENGNFSVDFKLDISEEDINAQNSVTAYAGAKGVKTPAYDTFKCYSGDTVNSVLQALKVAENADSVVQMIEGKVTVNGVKVNDILQLTTAEGSDYAGIKDKAAVCESLQGVTFGTVKSVWDAFDTAVSAQKDYEARVEAALLDLNAAVWDSMEEKLGSYTSLLNLKLTEGSYTSLTDTEKITLYKNLANTYTFTFGADINGYIETTSAGIIAGRSGGGGSGGLGGSGSSGGREKNDTEMKVSGLTGGTENNSGISQGFKDLGDVLWAKESIEYLAERSIVNGIGNNLFAPNDYVTREQFVKIMVLAGGIGSFEEQVSFSDVSESDWFAPYVAAGVKNSLVNGMGDGSFGSGKNITRQDLAVFLVRLAKFMGKELPSAENSGLYNDDSDISGYAHSAVYTLHSAGIMNGMGEGIFAPQGSVTRAMAAKAVYELLQYGE